MRRRLTIVLEQGKAPELRQVGLEGLKECVEFGEWLARHHPEWLAVMRGALELNERQEGET